MTVEEKKAIDIINYNKNKTPFIFWYENKPYNKKEIIETVLKLIEKLQYKIDEKELIIDGMKEDRRILYQQRQNKRKNSRNNKFKC